jgi:hypothetical protein
VRRGDDVRRIEHDRRQDAESQQPEMSRSEAVKD